MNDDFRLELINLIPQREPFVMIDSLIEHAHHHYVTGLSIRKDNLFVQDGRFTEFGLIENVAQTMAAGLALSAIDDEIDLSSSPNSEGLLGAIDKLELFDQVSIGDEIETTVDVIGQFGAIYKAKGVVHSKGKTIMSCVVKVVGVPDVKENN